MRERVKRLEKVFLAKEKLSRAKKEIQKLKDRNTELNFKSGPQATEGGQTKLLENNTASCKKEWKQHDNKTMEMKEIIKE